MALDRDDELDLIKQVVSLEVMQGQNMMMLKEIKDDLKALTLEHRNYRQSMDTRLGALERFQERQEKSDLDNRIQRLEGLEKRIKGGWVVILVVAGIIWELAGNYFKRLI